MLKMNNQLNLTSTTLLKDLRVLVEELITKAEASAFEQRAQLNHSVQPTKIPCNLGNPLKIASIDSTCITLNATSSNLTLAARATVITHKPQGGYLCIRSSPIVREFSNLDAVVGQSFTQERVESVVRGALEMCIIKRLLEEQQSEMILVDGVLDEPLGSPFREFKRKLVSEALSREVDLVGFSKDSRLPPIVALLSGGYAIPDTPWFIYASQLSFSGLDGESGVYVARLAEQGLTLRVDLISRRKAEDVFADLITSDRYYRGYPESLRLAHHLTVFTGLEVLTLKVATKRVEAPIIELGGRRALLLGSLKRSR
ncbi:MAG: DNA double-strand break repair nuclease NurA [Nitrososphaerales archaeon]